MLDRVIRALAPQWAVRRAAARAQLDEIERLGSSPWRGATHDRVDRGRPTFRGSSADWINESTYDRRELVDRARQLERDSLLAEALLSASALNVVGRGFRLQAQTDDAGWNQAVEDRWRQWADREADSRGLATLDEILALIHRSWLRDGDVGTVLQSDGRIRLVESDEIASPEGPFSAKPGVDGIDLDKDGRPVAYHIVKSPVLKLGGDRRAYPETVRVSADQVIFLARRQRLGQTRGMSAFAGVSWIFDQIDGQIEAITTAARMAAIFGLVFKRTTRFNASALGTTTDGANNTRKQLHMEPGMFLELNPGEELDQVKPQHPHENFSEFIRLLTRLVARPFGLPLEVALLDFSQANFSSSRGALLQAWQTWRCDQGMLERYMSRLYLWKLAEWTKLGEIPLRGDASKHVWQKPGWQWVDPAKEIQAGMAGVDAGFDTRTAIAARMGLDFEEIMRTRAREEKLAGQLGVELSRSNITRELMPAPEEAAAGSRPGPSPR